MTVIGSGDRTRLVIELVELVPYVVNQSGNDLLISIGNEAGSGVVSSGTLSSASEAGVLQLAGPHLLRWLVLISREAKGDGQVLISLILPMLMSTCPNRVELSDWSWLMLNC